MSEKEGAPQNVLPASLEDLHDVPLAAPLRDVESWTCEKFRGRFGRAARDEQDAGRGNAARAYQSLAILCSFWPTYDNPAQPYRAEHIDYAEGERSAEPDDLTSDDLAVVAQLFDLCLDAALRARLGDVLFLHRRRKEVWPSVVIAYMQAADRLMPADSWEAVPLYQRALQLAHKLGRKNEVWQQAEASVLSATREHASVEKRQFPARMMKLMLGMNIGEASEWGEIAENLARESKATPRFARTYWALSAAWWTKAKEFPRAEVAKLHAAETYVEEAEASVERDEPSYSAAAGFLAQAVIALRRAGASEERVTEIKARLRKYQQQIGGEFRTVRGADQLIEAVDCVTHASAEQAVEFVTQDTLEEALTRLAFGAPLVDPAHLREKVIESAKDNPMLHLVSENLVDSQGRTIHRGDVLFHL